MIKRKIKWVSTINKKEHVFNSKREALDFEDKNKKEQIIEKMDKSIEELTPVVRRYFKDSSDFIGKKWWRHNDRFNIFCVDCGKHLVQFDEEMDGHDSHPGKLLLNEKCSLFLDGTRCERCDKKSKKMFQDILDLYYKTNKLFVWDILDLYKEGKMEHIQKINKKSLFAFFQMVKKWHEKQDQSKNA